MKVVVIVPTYSEIESLKPIVGRVWAAVPGADILVVNDNSPDGMGDLADELASADSHVLVLRRAEKEGLGKAYIAAFSWATDKEYTHVVQMDADGFHRPEQLPLLLERAAMGDRPNLIIGSRYVRGGELEGWSESRRILSRAGNFYIKVWPGLPASDITAGLRVYRVAFLRRLDLSSVESAGYFFQANTTDKVHQLGGSIVEMPTSFAQREAGESKLSAGIFTESLKRTMSMGAKRHRRQLADLARRAADRLHGKWHHRARRPAGDAKLAGRAAGADLQTFSHGVGGALACLRAAARGARGAVP